MTRAAFALLLTLVLAASAAVALVHATADRALETHEIFVAQSTREMFEFHEPLVPSFGEVPRLKKPPLMYWVVGAIAMVAGREDVPEWVARLPSAFAAIGLAAIAGAMGRVVYGRAEGVLAAGMTGLSLGVFEYAASARPEMLYAATSALSILLFLIAWERRGSAEDGAERTRDTSGRWAMGAWLMVGVATLVKGPQLPLLVLIGMSAWAIRESGWRQWARTFRPLTGMLAATAVVAPWFIAVMARVDGAAQIWLDELIGQRFGEKDGTTATFAEWLRSVATPDYLVHAITLLAPWGLLLPLAAIVPWMRTRAENERGRMLFMGIAAAVVGLSLVRHSRDYYILPLAPMIAVLLARAALGMYEQGRARVSTRRIAVGLMALLGGGGVGLMVYAVARGGVQPKDVLVVSCAAGAVAACALLLLYRFKKDRSHATVAAALAAWGCALVSLGTVTPEPGARRERLDDVARAAAALAGTELPVIAIEFDPSNLMYRVDDPPIAFQPDASNEDVLARLPAVLVAPPEWADRIDAIERIHVRHSAPIDIKAGRSIEVVLITREP